MNDKTKESQYQICVEEREKGGLTRLGLMSSYVWKEDPRRLLFLLSRYKFVAKMFSGSQHVLEVGCGDAFGSRIVLQEVRRLTVIDFDPVFLKDIQERMDPSWMFECRLHDMVQKPMDDTFDAVYALDVIEHIQPKDEVRFVRNITRSLTPKGALIIGVPSLQSQSYASPASREGHVNCKDQKGLKDLMERFFHNVFIFSMNDEVVHTGFSPMAHYLIALCVCPRVP